MIGHRVGRAPGASLAGLVTGLLSALLQLGPVLGGGFVLTRDMVFVPRLPLDAHLLGVDTVPRAVPSDLLVALASRLVGGEAVQDLVLVAIIAGAGWGAARLASRDRVWVAVGAAALYSWNPYLAERLRQGQWAVLLGYAALPWIAVAAGGVRDGTAGSGRRLLLALGLAACGGASAELLGALVAVPVVLWPGGAGSWRRRAGQLLGSLVVVALPWLVPSLTTPVSYPPDRVGFVLFAARPEGPFGTLGTLLGLGGIWNAADVPAGRGLVLVAALTIVLTVASVAVLLRAREDRAGLVAAGALGLLLAVAGAVPGLRGAVTDLGSSGIGGGLLRDGQRSLAPFVLLVAVGFGLLIGAAARRVRLAPAFVVAPALLLPAAAWGEGGAFAAVRWPADWSVVAAAAARLPAGPVLVLPWSSQRVYAWDGGRVLTDPTDRWIARRVVGDDALQVGRQRTPTEDPLARAIAAEATGTGPLAAALRSRGYGGVLLERDQPGAAREAARLAPLPVAVQTPTLTLYRVPDAARVPAPPAASPATAIVAGGVTVGAVLAAAGTLGFQRVRRRGHV